jgi:hypothetical protein
MRTTYPTPSFSDQYNFKLVDSTFIHAVHLAKSKGSWTYSLGISLQKEQDTIYWYIVNDAQGLYRKLTDPKKSPGFTYNNSVKGKQYTKQEVVDKAIPAKTTTSTNFKLDEIESYWAGKKSQPIPKAPEKPAKVEYVSTYGPLLDTVNKQSSCIAYLGLGYNRSSKGFVIYYALKNNVHNVYAIETDDASIYRGWVNSESLGRYFNQVIRKFKPVLLKTLVAPANGPGGPCGEKKSPGWNWSKP